MSAVRIDAETLRKLAELVALCLDREPSMTEIADRLSRKLEEKDIHRAYEDKLITEDEVCSFILASVYTEFVKDQENIRSVETSVVERLQSSVKKSIFGT